MGSAREFPARNGAFLTEPQFSIKGFGLKKYKYYPIFRLLSVRL